MIEFRFLTGNDYLSRPETFYEEPQATYISCPYCGGDGGVWYNGESEEIDKVHYESLSEEDKILCEFVECEHCEGLGTIEDYNS